ncbi:hypothetical protein RO3G_13548 [Rhizopus delemar RA 99-880]|uniref:Uncharacterized protein n=1 Tax=Rhizopus delemar (strain RA 99-880 / ATCC MYA-4621 / FGSC 9543 / NRRL 43880) TaxID=246409 RepID=I1CK57_RHIO9|nr:hypothetical protein RO3G_13548 [Rhizopus delemar RA 99-880]|eukprot:EIE88837.1 hypothetical protein RO3G_13548 [Rhizopus delemar RA 99-880]
MAKDTLVHSQSLDLHDYEEYLGNLPLLKLSKGIKRLARIGDTQLKKPVLDSEGMLKKDGLFVYWKRLKQVHPRCEHGSLTTFKRIA